MPLEMLRAPVLAPYTEALDALCPDPRNVLLVRCAPPGLVRTALDGLVEAFPQVKVSLLCQPGHRIEGLDCILNPGNGFLRLEDLDCRELLRRNFDLALIPCSTTRRLSPSYYNIENIVRATGAGRVVYLFSDLQALSADPAFLERKATRVTRPYLARRTAAIWELAEYTGEDMATVERKCDLAGLRALELWRQQDPRTEAEVCRYYQENDFYLYELLKTEYNGDEAELVREVVSLCRAGERVLEFGGGVGTLSLALAAKGCRMTHLDLPGKLLDFAAWRFARRGAPVEVHPLADEADLGGPYDCLVSVFVLEHLVDPESTLRNMRAAVAPGGRMLLAVDFEESPVKTEPLPLHLNRMSRVRYRELADEIGLAFRGSRGALDIFEVGSARSATGQASGGSQKPSLKLPRSAADYLGRTRKGRHDGNHPGKGVDRCASIVI